MRLIEFIEGFVEGFFVTVFCEDVVVVGGLQDLVMFEYVRLTDLLQFGELLSQVGVDWFR